DAAESGSAPGPEGDVIRDEQQREPTVVAREIEEVDGNRDEERVDGKRRDAIEERRSGVDGEVGGNRGRRRRHSSGDRGVNRSTRLRHERADRCRRSVGWLGRTLRNGADRGCGFNRQRWTNTRRLLAAERPAERARGSSQPNGAGNRPGDE